MTFDFRLDFAQFLLCELNYVECLFKQNKLEYNFDYKCLLFIQVFMCNRIFISYDEFYTLYAEFLLSFLSVYY